MPTLRRAWKTGLGFLKAARMHEEVGMNIYVGSLANDVTGTNLRQTFEAFGQVASARVMKGKISGESRGFGFVEMPVLTEARAAIRGLNGTQLKGQPLSVNEVRERTADSEVGTKSGGGRRN